MSNIRMDVQEVCGIIKKYAVEKFGVEVDSINADFSLKENEQGKWELVISGFDLKTKEKIEMV